MLHHPISESMYLDYPVVVQKSWPAGVLLHFEFAVNSDHPSGEVKEIFYQEKYYIDA